MVKRSRQPSGNQGARCVESRELGPRAPGSTPTATPKRPYERPRVEKRRSLIEATLFSGTGVPGVLVG